MQRAISTCLMRGGSSKGVFLRASDLPPAGELRDSVILRLFGSPDPRQIDGLGGADVLTSKLAIVGPPSVAGADVDYTFGQVSLINAMIDYRGNCGNISAAVGPFAIDEGLVQLAPFSGAETLTQCVRIHNTNTGAILRATIPVGIHGACVHGATTVGGVPGSGARIDLDFSDTQGSVTGRLLPTGHLYETVEVAGEGEEPEHVQVTLLDAGQPTVFVTASSLGMPMEIRAAEIAGILERSPSLMRRVERLRGACAVLMGIVESWEDAERVSPYTPFVAILSPASDSSCDITSTVVFMQSVHKAYPVTGSVATLAAALLPGTLAHSVLSKGPCTGPLRIGHPTGVMEMEGLVEEEKLVKASITRTARRLMDGNAYVPWSTWPVE